MNNERNDSRRNFIKHSSLGLGAGIVGVSNPFTNTGKVINDKLPGEVCAASIDLKGLRADTTTESRITQILERMNEVTGMRPDIICLPELFDTVGLNNKSRLAR